MKLLISKSYRKLINMDLFAKFLQNTAVGGTINMNSSKHRSNTVYFDTLAS